MTQFYFSILDVLDRFQEIGILILVSFWWFILFIIVFPLFMNLLLWWRQTLYKANINWVILEIKPPRETRKNPKAMEQILIGIHALRNSPSDFYEKWVEGEVTKWFSLEIASLGGEIHFYVRAPSRYKNVIEANFYAHYPEVEIFPVEDYIYRLPQTTKELYQAGLNLFGSEFVLGKEDAYPIRTYYQFEAVEEEAKLDPISTLTEILGKLKKEEQLWLQFLIRPAGPEWKERGDKLVKELKEKASGGTAVKTKEGSLMPMFRTPTPGEIEVMKAIEQNISKNGFDTVIRTIYFSSRETMSDVIVRRGIPSILNQYSSLGLNFFLHNYRMRTETPHWYRFPFFNIKQRGEGRKQRILKNYQNRSLPEELTIGKFLNLNPANFNFYSKTFILNTEELATLYHLPYYFVLTAPFISELESKRIGPPAGLPIFKE